MTDINITITRATVIVRSQGMDLIRLHTNLPSPYPAIDSEPLTLEFQVVKGGGVGYLIEHFQLTQDVITVIND